MLTLWGRANSINVQKALMCLEETGAPYERIDAGRQFGVNDTPDYLAMNPNGLVPTLRDGDFVLWESNVIVRYLATTFSRGVLAPDDPIAFAEADRWMDWQQTALSPAMNAAFHGLVRTPGSRPQAEVADSVARSSALFDILERRLSSSVFVGGAAFTMADCVIAPAAHRWLNMPVERPRRPALAAWYEALMTRPSAQRVLRLPIT